MKADGDGELDAREQFCVHARVLVPPAGPGGGRIIGAGDPLFNAGDTAPPRFL